MNGEPQAPTLNPLPPGTLIHKRIGLWFHVLDELEQKKENIYNNLHYSDRVVIRHDVIKYGTVTPTKISVNLLNHWAFYHDWPLGFIFRETRKFVSYVDLTVAIRPLSWMCKSLEPDVDFYVKSVMAARMFYKQKEVNYEPLPIALSVAFAKTDTMSPTGRTLTKSPSWYFDYEVKF